MVTEEFLIKTVKKDEKELEYYKVFDDKSKISILKVIGWSLNT